jgi:cation transport ATPase
MKNELKLQVAMITGDNKHTAIRVANHLGISMKYVDYRAYPNEKKEKVRRYQ